MTARGDVIGTARVPPGAPTIIPHAELGGGRLCGAGEQRQSGAGNEGYAQRRQSSMLKGERPIPDLSCQDTLPLDPRILPAGIANALDFDKDD